MSSARWRDEAEFPASGGDWSVLYPTFGVERHGQGKVEKHLRRGQPANPVLVSSPATGGRFLPPVLLEPQRLTARIHRDVLLMLAGACVITVFFLIVFHLGTGLRGSIFFASVYLPLCAFFGFNAWILRSRDDAVSERWMFYGWCFSQRAYYAKGFLLLMLAIGALQLLGGYLLGSAEAYKLALGVVYAELPGSGEWWRLATAALVHNGLAHWLINTLMGTGLLAVYGPVIGFNVVVAAVVAAPVAFLAVLVAAWNFPIEGIGIIGISGACAGFMGCFFAANLRRPDSFPAHYAVVTFSVAAATLFLVSFTMSPGSFIAHLAGFAAGLLVGLVVDPFSPDFHRPDAGTLR